MQPLSQQLVLYINRCSRHSTYYQVARYVLEHIERVSHMNSHELAEASFVSQSTVSRFVLSLGFPSYQAFIEACKEYLADFALSDLPQYHEKKDWKKQLLFEQKHICLTFEQLDMQQISRLLRDIDEANEVYMVATGQAALELYEFQVQLYTLKKPTFIIDDPHKIEDLPKIDKNTLIFAISASGHLFNSYRKLLSILEKLPNKKWLLTESISGQHLSHFDEVIYMDQGTQQYQYFTMRFLLNHILYLYYQYHSDKETFLQKNIE